MFFVLSGFLIVTLLLREKERFGNISLKKFYMRRTLRIFPIYYGILFALSLIFLFVKPGTDMARTFFPLLPFYLTYTSNWITQQAVNLGVTWSLATEEQFYMIWPAIEKFVKGWWLALILITVVVLNQLMNFQVIDPWFREWFGVGHSDLSILQITFTPIAFGVGLAHLLHHPKVFRLFTRSWGAEAA